jgi:DNA repair protein RadC
MGYTQETTTQMTLLAEEKITKTKQVHVPIYKISLVREGRVSCYEQQIRCSANASTLLQTYLADVDREHFVVLLLNQKNRVIGIHTVSVGSLTASVVHPRETLCAVCAVVGYRYQR